MCSWTITNPGSTVRPARSSTCAPAGMLTRAESPTARMRPRSRTTTWSGRAWAPVPSITRACTRATTGVSTVTKARVSGESGGAWADAPATTTLVASASASARQVGSLMTRRTLPPPVRPVKNRIEPPSHRRYLPAHHDIEPRVPMTETLSATPPLTLLTEEEELFRSTVREFAETEIGPYVSAMDEAAQFRTELLPKFFELGLMGIGVPERFGGAGGSIFMATLAIEELARVDASAAI